MKKHLVTAHLLAALLGLVQQGHCQQGNQTSSPYAPVYAQCPQNLAVRNASQGLSPQEQAWRNARGTAIKSSLRDYLRLANISGLQIDSYIDALNASTVPVVALSVSGGGTQSGIGGLGIWQAFDSRFPPAVSARTGGLTQILSYITGLSGGGAVTVALLAANNFSTVSDLRKATNFSASYVAGPTGNTTAFFNTIFNDIGAKDELGFPVSVADTFGQFWGSWLPKNQTYANYSDMASNSSGSAFAAGLGPMPIVTLVEVVPGVSPTIGDIMYPGFNSTNGFNLTSYEVTPFEFGSWLGGRVQGFMPLQYLGTGMVNGSAQNSSQCVLGFDKLSFMQGSTTDAYAAYFIDDFYGIPEFAKRSLGMTHRSLGTTHRQPTRRTSHSKRSEHSKRDIPIPPSQLQSPLVQIVNETAVTFQQTINDTLWSTIPNPFLNYSSPMTGVSDLLLLDGSLAGENNPVRPLIVPPRGVDFIIVYEASSEAKFNWVNGTSLQITATSAAQGNIPFPKIPSVNTMIASNFTTQPTFFGCNQTNVPLVLYLPNSPWIGYSNFSYMKSSFTDRQLNDTLWNAFALATYGNSTLDANWPACLACAAISKSLARVGVSLPDQCSQCFSAHCWNGVESSANFTAAQLDLKPKWNSTLTFDQWNRTVWEADSQGGGNGSGSPGAAGYKPGLLYYLAVLALGLTVLA